MRKRHDFVGLENLLQNRPRQTFLPRARKNRPQNESSRKFALFSMFLDMRAHSLGLVLRSFGLRNLLVADFLYAHDCGHFQTQKKRSPKTRNFQSQQPRHNHLPADFGVHRRRSDGRKTDVHDSRFNHYRCGFPDLRNQEKINFKETKLKNILFSCKIVVRL